MSLRFARAKLPALFTGAASHFFASARMGVGGFRIGRGGWVPRAFRGQILTLLRLTFLEELKRRLLGLGRVFRRGIVFSHDIFFSLVYAPPACGVKFPLQAGRGNRVRNPRGHLRNRSSRAALRGGRHRAKIPLIKSNPPRTKILAPIMPSVTFRVVPSVTSNIHAIRPSTEWIPKDISNFLVNFVLISRNSVERFALPHTARPLVLSLQLVSGI